MWDAADRRTPMPRTRNSFWKGKALLPTRTAPALRGPAGSEERVCVRVCVRVCLHVASLSV